MPVVASYITKSSMFFLLLCHINHVLIRLVFFPQVRNYYCILNQAFIWSRRWSCWGRAEIFSCGIIIRVVCLNDALKWVVWKLCSSFMQIKPRPECKCQMSHGLLAHSKKVLNQHGLAKTFLESQITNFTIKQTKYVCRSWWTQLHRVIWHMTSEKCQISTTLSDRYISISVHVFTYSYLKPIC